MKTNQTTNAELLIVILIGVFILTAAWAASDAVLIQGFNGSAPVPIRADLSTRAMVGISYEHHEIHDGRSYIVTDAVSVDDGNTRELLIETPDTAVWAHFTFVVTGSLDTTVEFFETTTKTTGTAMTELNRNRNSGNSTSVVVTHTPGGAGDGNLIFVAKFGGDTGPSGSGGLRGESRPEGEIMLGQNEKYLIKITSGTNGNNITTTMSWYDHSDEA